MRKVAWAFAGQGAESSGMGLELAEHFPEAAQLLSWTSHLLKLDVVRLLSRGSKLLQQTAILQPVLVAVSLGAAAALRSRGQEPDVVLGHSLGEWPAWSVAGGVDPTVAIELAVLRGSLMAEQAQRHPGGLVTLEGYTFEDIVSRLSPETTSQVALAADNGAGILTLASLDPTLGQLCSWGGTRLPVAGAWHHPCMAEIVPPIERVIRAAERETLLPMISNRSGQLIPAGCRIGADLAHQLAQPVQWGRSIETLASLGVTDLVLVGPARRLRGLVSRQVATILDTHLADDLASLNQLMEDLA